jgi:hypothetical protein
MNTTNLCEQMVALAESLGLQLHKVERGQGFADYCFFGLEEDVLDLSRALKRAGLQHVRAPLGTKFVLTAKFIWTPENIL